VLNQYVETQLTCCSDAVDGEAEPDVYIYLEHGLVIPLLDLGPSLLKRAMAWNVRKKDYSGRILYHELE
jgi:hypothetical protein